MQIVVKFEICFLSTKERVLLVMYKVAAVLDELERGEACEV